ncbi:MAG: WD40 repeat domain-containing protein, partial [Cyanobacteria bacterium P01_G01_bin.38]
DTLTGHQAAVYSVAYSLDGKLIASSSADKTVKVWQQVSSKTSR